MHMNLYIVQWSISITGGVKVGNMHGLATSAEIACKTIAYQVSLQENVRQDEVHTKVLIERNFQETMGRVHA